MNTYKIIGKDLQDKHMHRDNPLADWINNGGYGYGLFETDERNMPRAEIQDFILSQFERFNVPFPPAEVIDIGINVAFHHISSWDPYYMFAYNMTEVDITNGWMVNTYKITQDNGKLIELDTDDLETFVACPGQDIQSFNHYMNAPGLTNIPDGEFIDSHLCGEG